MNSARLPTLSTRSPKSGVAIIAANGQHAVVLTGDLAGELPGLDEELDGERPEREDRRVEGHAQRAPRTRTSG